MPNYAFSRKTIVVLSVIATVLLVVALVATKYGMKPGL
jgi:hypothetical protein